MPKKLKPPKIECCVSTSRCGRCPLRALKEGTLPDGYGVKKRKVVRLDAKSRKVSSDELAAALRKQHKKSKKRLAA